MNLIALFLLQIVLAKPRSRGDEPKTVKGLQPPGDKTPLTRG